MTDNSTKKTIGVALGVCLVCSILVSTAAVTLKGIQKANQKKERLKNILEAGDLLVQGENIDKIFQEKIQAEIIDLETGKVLSADAIHEGLQPETFDIKLVARNPELSKKIPANQDLAQIRQMPKFMVIYKVMEESEVIKYILPIYGKGLWSTMYGFIALDRDLVTIQGFTFYEHGETPGLGGEVDNPLWKKSLIGKQAFDADRNLIIHVIKGKVDAASPKALHQVDGLSGSTLTTRGVDQTIRFWIGNLGYGPFLKN